MCHALVVVKRCFGNCCIIYRKGSYTMIRFEYKCVLKSGQGFGGLILFWIERRWPQTLYDFQILLTSLSHSGLNLFSLQPH